MALAGRSRPHGAVLSIATFAGRDFPASVRRIQRHKILVVGSFIIGLDVDEQGIGKRVADTAEPLSRGHTQHIFSDAASRQAVAGPNEFRAKNRSHLVST